MNYVVEKSHSRPGNHRAEHQRGGAWRRVAGRIGATVLATTVGIAGSGLALSAVHNALKGPGRDLGEQLSETATGYIHDLAQSAMATYNAAVKNHSPYAHSKEGGKEAIISIPGVSGLLMEEVVSTRTVPGPNGHPEPNPANATKITTSMLVPRGVRTVTITPTRVTMATSTSSSEQVAQTNYSAGASPTTSISNSELNGPEKPPATDPSLDVAQHNLDAAAGSAMATNDALQSLTAPTQQIAHTHPQTQVM